MVKVSWFFGLVVFVLVWFGFWWFVCLFVFAKWAGLQEKNKRFISGFLLLVLFHAFSV